MSKVDHPQHYGGDTPYEVIKVLRAWLTPAEFIGFLKGNLIKYTARANQKGRLEDHEKGGWYNDALVEFIADQRRADEPDGMSIEPVFWTDDDPDLQADLTEVLGCAPIMHPFLLCSSVEPHARWAILPHDDDREPSFFRTKALAQKACDEALENGRRERAAAIQEARDFVLKGEINQAATVCDTWEIDFVPVGPNAAVIDGVTVAPGVPSEAELGEAPHVDV